MLTTGRIRNDSLFVTIIRTVISIGILIGIVYLGKIFIKSELENIGLLFFEKFGLIGLFVDVYIVDTFIVPATPDLFLGLLVAAGHSQIAGLSLICLASVLGGISGYWIGNKLGRRKIVQKLTGKYQQRGEALFQRYGFGAVIIAGLTPIPFSSVCWLAGMFKMKFSFFFLATLTRIPRMLIWYYLIAYVWQSH